ELAGLAESERAAQVHAGALDGGLGLDDAFDRTDRHGGGTLLGNEPDDIWATGARKPSARTRTVCVGFRDDGAPSRAWSRRALLIPPACTRTRVNPSSGARGGGSRWSLREANPRSRVDVQ